MAAKVPLKEPIVIPRADHNLSRANISPNALKVMYRLRSAGFQACLVGGGVRDLLLGREPKDFDIGTDAHPEDIKSLFRNCRLIGRRFRLAHVQFGREIIEVATFRAPGSEEEDSASQSPNGRLLRDNVYGNIEEDAWRRDFTVNALYYDIENFSVLDYADGMVDLQAGVLRLIGDPEQRYREDPVRMLRAVRFAAKLGFRIHPETEAPIHRLGQLLLEVPPARLFDEILKLFQGGYGVQTFELLRLYGLFEFLFPLTEQSLNREFKGFPRTLLMRALANTDTRVQEGKPITPAFLYAALLWEPLREHSLLHLQRGESEHDALHIAADEVINAQVKHTAVPRRFSIPMREIWELQSRFSQRSGKRPLRFLEHPRFRAAYDFMLLRAAAGDSDEVKELAEWWTEFQTLEMPERSEVAQPQSDAPLRPRRPRRRRAASND